MAVREIFPVISDDAEMHLTYKDNKWVISTDASLSSSATSGTNKV